MRMGVSILFTVDLMAGSYYHTPPVHNWIDVSYRDWRNWTVTAHTTDSITFSLVDPDGANGFPGEVVSYVTYTLTP